MLDASARFAHALCVYAEPLVRSRRVIVVGDASIGLGQRLLDLGARSVHVYDPLRERARENAEKAPRGVQVRELPAGDLEVRDGAFDLALVPDLASVFDPAVLLARLRRLVGGAGSVLVAAANPESTRVTGRGSIAYAELYDLLSLQFENVRMIAQLPFEGLAIAELGEADEEPAVSVDTQLVEQTAEPDRYLALASDRDVRLDAYSIVQVPRASSEARRPVPDDSQAVIAEAQLRAELLEAQLEEQRTLSRRRGMDASRVPQLEAELASVTQRLAEVERRSAEHQQRAERLVFEQRRFEEEAQRVREHATRAAKETEAARRDAAAAQRRVAELESAVAAAAGVEAALRYKIAERGVVPQVDPAAIQKLAERADRAERAQAKLELELASIDEAHAREVAQLEAKLHERGEVVAELEREIARRDRIVRELVATLEEKGAPVGATPAQAPPPPAPAQPSKDEAQLRAKLDKLAMELARREGELQARAWRITELEQQVSAAPAGGGSDPRLAALEKEVDVLRQALAQEHEARRQVESGDALRKAQSELARQATLIEQLSRELDQRQRASS
jgi:hypothetical protein